MSFERPDALGLIVAALPFVALGVGLLAAGHALLEKRDPSAALAWIAVCLVFPLLGPLLYFAFGINRVRTRARRLSTVPSIAAERDRDRASEQRLPTDLGALTPLNRISAALSERPLSGGNTVELLHNGEAAYPAMLEAIAGARSTVYLSTYIFETNATGRRFVAHMAEARRRGVDVRVIVDGIGELYSRPRASAVLGANDVPVARFLPPKLLPPTLRVNLRTHRKILTVDGHTAFVGGMNIGDRHLAADIDNPRRVVDLQCRLRGPVVGDIQRVFHDDWAFALGSDLDDACVRTVASSDQQEPAKCRVLTDGPDNDPGRMLTVLVGAISVARSSVWIMTPYFLPPRDMISALQAAALRGVDVAIVLPGRNNLAFVHWASRRMLWELLQRGVRIYYQPGPFVHTKLFLVDQSYAQIGSANIDPRSLRLNFELAVEIFDAETAARMRSHFAQARSDSRELTFEEIESRPLITKLRDAAAWLFSPYL